MQFEFLIASRYLRAKRRQDLRRRLTSSTADVNLMRVANDGIRNWRELLARMEKQPHVVAASPALYEQVLISRGARSDGAVVKGVQPEHENKVTDLLKSLELGSAEAINADRSRAQGELPPIVLGKEMADDLGASPGSIVLVTSPQGELTPFGMVPKYVRFKIVGIFHSGFYDYDKSWAFIRLDDAQQLFGLGDMISVVEFKLKEQFRAADAGRQLEQAAGQGFMSTNWMA